MILRSGYLLLAQRLQEAADMNHSDVRSRLSDAVNDAHRGTGNWASYIDHTGDGTTGDCIYSVNGDVKKAPYELGEVGGKATGSIDTAKAKSVIPVTTYQEEADDTDHYTTMESTRMYTATPIYERFISKDTRKSMSADDFAGKNRSFPISTQADVEAAFHSLGRAGSDNYGSSTIRANIIKIAKRKGLTLPASAQESAPVVSHGTLRLCESAGGFLEEVPLREARTNYPVKLISPGTGSMAHYPAAVLERDGPKVFKKGTLMFWNHPTRAEEAARPEGDLDNLAAILTRDATWDANGKQGPGLYAEAKVMADYAQKIQERAPHIGLSIRAGGTGTGKTVDGKPELKSIDYAESVDYVTKAGRGGLALAEAARNAGLLEEVSDMDAAELTKLQESVTATQAQNALLLERAIKGDAREEAVKILSGVSLHESAKAMVIENVLRDIPKKDGALDTAKFTEAVNTEAKRVGAVVAASSGSGLVFGMGSVTKTVEPAEAARIAEAAKRTDEDAANVFKRFGLTEAAAKAAAGIREAA